MKLDIARRQRVQRLADAYSELLTRHQRETLALHLDRDWSYSEIAQSQGVSRAAVHDLVRRTEAILAEYEAKLGLVAGAERRRDDRSRVERQLDELQADIRALRRQVKAIG
jgi:predicted DNA-binding protein YlxM (UPF0122 family)